MFPVWPVKYLSRVDGVGVAKVWGAGAGEDKRITGRRGRQMMWKETPWVSVEESHGLMNMAGENSPYNKHYQVFWDYEWEVAQIGMITTDSLGAGR